VIAVRIAFASDRGHARAILRPPLRAFWPMVGSMVNHLLAEPTSETFIWDDLVEQVRPRAGREVLRQSAWSSPSVRY
jgi:hypothetical protein